MRKKPRTPGVRRLRPPVRRVLDDDDDGPLFENREPIEGFPGDPKEESAAAQCSTHSKLRRGRSICRSLDIH